MSLKFVPPATTGKTHVYATWTPSYGLKVYSNLGSAKQGLSARLIGWRNGTAREEGKILQAVEGEWFTLFDVTEGTTEDTLPWKKEVTTSSYSYSYGGYSGRNRETKKVAVSMTREEYAEWRVAVELELRGITA